jgi:hypothetical protein
VSYVAEQNVDLIMIGGDVAYDDAMLTCYYSWDTFFSMFDQLTISNNHRLIPIITSIGNHDVRTFIKFLKKKHIYWKFYSNINIYIYIILFI